MKLFEIAGPDYGESDIMFRAIVGLLKKGEILRTNYVMELHDSQGIYLGKKRHEFQVSNIGERTDIGDMVRTNSTKLAILFKDDIGDKKVWMPYEELGKLELVHRNTHWELTGMIADGNQPGDDWHEEYWGNEDEDH